MPFVTDGVGLWEMGQLPVRAGIISTEGSPTVSDAWAHTGTYSLRVANASYTRQLPTPRADFSQTAWIKGAQGNPIIYFRQSGGNVASLRYDGTYWDAYVGGNKVADGTIATTLTAEQRVSVHIITGAGGTIDTKIDGVTDIEYTGTVGSGNLDAVRFDLGGVANSFYVDDWVFGTGGWPGDKRVIFLAPTSDATKAWTASTGADNYACVDERPPSDTDYVSCTADQIDEYGCADFSGTGKVVGSVTVIARAKKSDGGSDDKITLGLGDGTNTADGSAVSVLTSYQHYWYTKSTAPDGGVWTDTDVDNLELRLLGDIA